VITASGTEGAFPTAAITGVSLIDRLARITFTERRFIGHVDFLDLSEEWIKINEGVGVWVHVNKS
jgi:hypothetical protein